MTEQDRPPPDPQELLRLKDELVSRFQQLPPEHQATMSLVLVREVMDGEWGVWLKGAIAILTEKQTPGSAIKQALLEQWGRLTPNEQAEVLVEQLRDVLGSDRGRPQQQELGLADEPPSED